VNAPRVEKPPDGLGADRVGMGTRRPGPLFESGYSSLLVALSPLVTGLSADAEASASLGHRQVATADGRHKLASLIHRGRRFPGHGRRFDSLAPKVSPMYRSDLSPMSPVYTGVAPLVGLPRRPPMPARRSRASRVIGPELMKWLASDRTSSR
jgi:hypothetical protein